MWLHLHWDCMSGSFRSVFGSLRPVSCLATTSSRWWRSVCVERPTGRGSRGETTPSLMRYPYPSTVTPEMILLVYHILPPPAWLLFSVFIKTVNCFFLRRCSFTMSTCCHQICLKNMSASGSVHVCWFEVLPSVRMYKCVTFCCCALLCRCMIPIHWGLTVSWESSRYMASFSPHILLKRGIHLHDSGWPCFILSHSWTLVIFMTNQVSSQTTDLCVIYICFEDAV